jgi:hypothetical protein
MCCHTLGGKRQETGHRRPPSHSSLDQQVRPVDETSAPSHDCFTVCVIQKWGQCLFALYASIPVSVCINLTRSRLVVEDTVVTKHLASLSGDHAVIILSECGKKILQ